MATYVYMHVKYLCNLNHAVRKRMDAMARASISKEERDKRSFEIGSELLQNTPSTKEELWEKLDAMGLFSNTKKSNFHKSSPSQDEALGSVSISKKSNFPKTSKKQRKRKSSRAQEEDSVDKAVEKHGEELIGCRVRVWWPLDQKFYEGHITSFDHSKKKHMVLYEDGDEETLNLTEEHWELVEEEDNASDPIQEIVPGPSDLSDSDMPLVCFIDPSLNIRKKKKGKATDGSHSSFNNDHAA